MRRILIVDDDASIRRLARIILADAGYDVIEAEHGEQALEVLSRESLDVLLLDVNMPVMDGHETFKHLREYPARPLTIIITAGPSERTRRELGAEASLQKPFGPDDLVETVSEVTRHIA